MPFYNMVAPVPVQVLREYIRDHGLHFSGTMVYLVSKVANSIPEFRWRIREDKVIEHDTVHPSFTVRTEDSDVFSFCYVAFVDDYPVFINALQSAQAAMRTSPSLEDAPERDDYLFMSSVPWVHFTGFSHAMHIPVRDSVPRISWGKIKSVNTEDLMPLGVQVHHSVVDGRHVGLFFERFEEYCMSPELALRIGQ